MLAVSAQCRRRRRLCRAAVSSVPGRLRGSGGSGGRFLRRRPDEAPHADDAVGRAADEQAWAQKQDGENGTAPMEMKEWGWNNGARKMGRKEWVGKNGPGTTGR